MDLGLYSDGNQPSGFYSITVDWTASTATFVLANGLIESLSLPSIQMNNPVVKSAIYYPHRQELHSQTVFGDTIVTEVAPTHQAMKNGRPIVYLDQKDWSLLANVIHEPDRVDSDEETIAAWRLITLARERRIILPMSMGHFTETAQWSIRERRYHLALTMVKLSRGWQLRNPGDIRLYELMRSMLLRIKEQQAPTIDMITLEGCAAQPGYFSRQPHGLGKGLPPRAATMVDTLVCISSQIKSILDRDAVPLGRIDGWVKSEQQFTHWLSQQPWDSNQKRQMIRNYFVQDISSEISEAARRIGLSSVEVSAWLKGHFLSDLPHMPHLSLYRELMVSKHVDRTTRWKRSDLHDMMYLSCGAGYADYVVGEKSLVSHINGAASRVGKPPCVYPKISQLVDELAEDVP